MKYIPPTTDYDRIMADHLPLTPVQERALKKRAKTEPKAVQELLWKHNLRFAVLLASRRFDTKPNSSPVLLKDLIQTAVIALWKSSGMFDFNNGAKFISYAGWGVKRALEDHLRDSSAGMTVPRSETARLRAARKLLGTGKKHHLYSDNQLKISLDRVSTPVFLDAPVEVGDGRNFSVSAHDALQGIDARTTLDKDDRREVLEKFMAKLAKLDARYPQILRARYGLDGEPQTLRELGVTLGITRERVRQLEERALKRLRAIAELRRVNFSDLTSRDDTF